MNNIQVLINAAKVALTPESSIARHEEDLFKSATLKNEYLHEIDTVLAKLLPGQLVYRAVSNSVNKDMPWWIVCLEHAMEAGAKQRPFNYHLHCGDSLTGRTFHVPKGRPLFNPGHGTNPPSTKNPYTFQESAIDAMKLAGYDKQADFSLGKILYDFEKFNGLGYRKYHPEVNSPYLWSFTSLYSKGKYVGDGKWDSSAVSEQPGCAAYLIRMKEQGVITV